MFLQDACVLTVITGVEVLGYTMTRQRSVGYGRWGVGYIAQRAAVLVCLLGFGDTVMGQVSSEWDPVKTVCNMVVARGVVLGDKMYVDGGEIMDQQNYKDGIDKPYPNSNMARWQSECPILHPVSYFLTDCLFTKSDIHISQMNTFGN